MWEPGDIDSLNSRIGANLRHQYTQVHVLLITWADNDLQDVDDEIRELRQVFEKDYCYSSVSYFRIPGKKSQARLNFEISNFVYNQSQGSDSLIIVYYAGHCGPDSEDKAEWYALEEGGPKLPWHTTQNYLFAAEGDVLLILDCCHASLITKGRKDEGGRFELIAASAIGRLTPVPGPSSFTKALIRLLKNHVEDGIPSESLASALREDKKITETPVFHDFVRESPTRIQLRRLQQSSSLQFVPKPTGYLFFRASLSGDTVGLQIADWLKTAPPKSVTAVHIEAIVSQARKMQEAGGKGQFPGGSLFSKLSSSAQAEIRRAMRDLNRVMATSADYAEGAPPAAVDEDNEAIEVAFEQLQNTVSAVSAAVQTPLLLQGAGCRGEVQVPSKQHLDDGTVGDNFDRLIATANVEAAVGLHNAVISGNPCQYAIEIPNEGVSIIATSRSSGSAHSRRFKLGTVNGSRAILETFTYRNASQSNGNPSAQLAQQIRKITGLLCHPKYNVFHTLPCLGFYQNRLRKEIGMVFKAPCTADLRDDGQLITLLDLYKDKAHRVVPLGTRIHLAWSLAKATEHFHRVGWLHKSLRSRNIAFVAQANDAELSAKPTAPDAQDHAQGTPPFTPLMHRFDLRNPLLFGFEYSRAGDETTFMDEDHKLANNVYRHPDRWGKPSARFRKSHDVYSLGVLLFEIANWKDVRSVLKIPEDGDNLGAVEVLADMIRRCDKNLPHQVGEVLTQCIKTCLRFDVHTKDMGEYDEQVYFQKNIAGPLERAVGRI